MKLKTIIVDDERLARQELKSLLTKHDEIEIIAEYGDPNEAIKGITELNPDLVFLDIQMPGKTGFELLEELEHTPHVIFVTAYDEFAIKAFEVNAMDYILKPVEDDRLELAINKSIKFIDMSNNELTYKSLPALAKLLKENTDLVVDVSFNKITTKLAARLVQCFEQ